MTALQQTLTAFARGAGQLLRLPSAILIGWAGFLLVVLALELWALLAPPGGPGVLGSALLIGLLVLLALPIVVLAIRRRRWLRLAEEAAQAAGPTVIDATPTSDSMTLVRIDSLSDRVEEEMRGRDGEEDVRAVLDAFTELQLPPTTQRGAGARLTRFFGAGRLAMIGRVLGLLERAQRALLSAAGGPARAPYLVDDMRVTIAAFAGTLVTIVVGGLAAIVAAAVLLTR